MPFRLKNYTYSNTIRYNHLAINNFLRNTHRAKAINTAIKNLGRSLQANYALLIGLAIVVLISTVTYHGDFLWLSRLAERTANGGLNLYQPLLAGQADLGKFTMPPLMGLVDGGLYFIFQSVGLIHFELGNSVGWTLSHFQLLLLKSRYILLFALSYPLIRKAAFHYTNGDRKLSQKIANIWITSPILLYLPFAQGNNDIFPAIATLIFLFFAFKREYVWAMLFLGLVAALKNYGVFLFLPMALIFAEKDIKKTIQYIGIAGTVYILPALVYLKEILHFLQSQGEGTMFLSTYLPSKFIYSVAPILYVLILAQLYFSDNTEQLKQKKNTYIVLYGFLTLSLLYTLNFFIPQWFLWILPFFVFLVYNNKRLFQLYVATNAVFLVSLFTNWQSNLDLKLLTPLLPAALAIPQVRPASLSEGNIPSIIISVFSALLIAFTYFAIKDSLSKSNRNFGSRYTVPFNLTPFLALGAVALLVLSYNLYQVDKGRDVANAVTQAVSQSNTAPIQPMADIGTVTYKNADLRADGLYWPSKNKSLVTITSPSIVASGATGQTYIAVKLSGAKRHYYNPTLGITSVKASTDDDATTGNVKSFTTVSAFTTYDGQLFYAPVERKDFDGVTKLELTLAGDTAPFRIDSIELVTLAQ